MKKIKLSKRKKINILFTVTGFIIIIQGISLIMPFIWMALTSFKGLLDYQEGFLALPKIWHFENFNSIFKLLKLEIIVNSKIYEYNVFDMLLNSFTLAIFKSLFHFISVILCSYVVAKYNFIGKRLIFNINIFVMIIPIVDSLSNTLIIFKQFQIYNNLWMYIIFPGSPFGFDFLLLYGAFRALPNSYTEAVLIDGGGHFVVLFKIILPLMLPIISALFMLSFIGLWNDYYTSLIYLPSVPTLAFGLYMFQYDSAKYGAILPEILAGFMICSIPSIILFCSFQKVITKSFTMGGLKE